ncbi:MAG: hypothetical protein M3R00_06395, partial [Pseudomonadota bacterium]|nr:hypothetical protein [Pseudomonadota bacterium]
MRKDPNDLTEIAYRTGVSEKFIQAVNKASSAKPRENISTMDHYNQMWAKLSHRKDPQAIKAMIKDLLILEADKFQQGKGEYTYLREECLAKAAVRNYILKYHTDFINLQTAGTYASQRGGVLDFFIETKGVPKDVIELFTGVIDQLETKDSKEKATKDILFAVVHT